jgi:hypothetical protein
MTIGIQLHVNSSEVRLAKEHLSGLKESLEEVNELRSVGTIDIGVDGIDRAKDAIRDVAKDIGKLRTLASTGDKKGGILRTDQFQEAANLSKEIKENFESYGTAIKTAETRLDYLISRRRELQKIQDTDYRSTVRGAAGKEQRKVDQEIEKLTRSLDNLTRQAEKLEKQGGLAAGRIDGFSESGGGIGSALSGLFSPAKMILGMVGLGGLLGVKKIAESAIDETVKYDVAESHLLMRGVNPLEREGRYGYKAFESLQLADTLNQQTGIGGDSLDGLTRVAQMFSRGRGISGEETTRYMGSIYQSTSLGPEGYEAQMRELTKAIKSLGVGGLTETYMQQSAALIDMLSSGRGGTPIQDSELSLANRLQADLWDEGVFGQGRSATQFLSKLQGGLVDGGKNPMEQMFFYNALGGATSVDEAWDLSKLRHQGLTGMSGGKSNMQRIMEYAEKQFGTDEEGSLSTPGRFALSNIFSLAPEQVEKLVDLRKEGAFELEGLKEVLGEGVMEKDAKAFLETRGGEELANEALLNETLLKIGHKIVPVMREIKGEIIYGADKIVDAVYRLSYGEREIISAEEMASQRFVMGGGGSNNAAETAPTAGTITVELTDEARKLLELMPNVEGSGR